MSIDTHALRTLIEESGVNFRQNSVSWIFTCPRCDKRDKLYLRKRDGHFICWRCATTEGYRGRAEYALRDLLGLSVRELQAKLYGDQAVLSDGPLINFQLDDFFAEEDVIPPDLDRPAPMPLSLDFIPLDHPHAARGLAYLEGRGIPLEVAREYGLAYHPQERRVIFPIVMDGRCVGWQARTTEPEEVVGEGGVVYRRLKVVTPRGVDRERAIMFFDRLQPGGDAVLTEGPVDAIKCHLCGGNMASMGASVSEGQIAAIAAKEPRRLYVGLDPDAAAEVTRLCREFSDIEVYHLEVPKPFKDLGQMSFEEVYEVWRSARRIRASHVFLPPLRGFFQTA